MRTAGFAPTCVATQKSCGDAQLHCSMFSLSSPAVLFTLPVSDGNQVEGINWISDNLQSFLGILPKLR